MPPMLVREATRGHRTSRVSWPRRSGSRQSTRPGRTCDRDVHQPALAVPRKRPAAGLEATGLPTIDTGALWPPLRHPAQSPLARLTSSSAFSSWPGFRRGRKRRPFCFRSGPLDRLCLHRWPPARWSVAAPRRRRRHCARRLSRARPAQRTGHVHVHGQPRVVLAKLRVRRQVRRTRRSPTGGARARCANMPCFFGFGNS